MQCDAVYAREYNLVTVEMVPTAAAFALGDRCRDSPVFVSNDMYDQHTVYQTCSMHKQHMHESGLELPGVTQPWAWIGWPCSAAWLSELPASAVVQQLAFAVEQHVLAAAVGPQLAAEPALGWWS